MFKVRIKTCTSNWLFEQVGLSVWGKTFRHDIVNEY